MVTVLELGEYHVHVALGHHLRLAEVNEEHFPPVRALGDDEVAGEKEVLRWYVEEETPVTLVLACIVLPYITHTHTRHVGPDLSAALITSSCITITMIPVLVKYATTNTL